MQQPTRYASFPRRTSYVVTQGPKQTNFTQYHAAYAFWRAVYWKTPGGFPTLTSN